MVQRDGKTALRPMASEIACATGYFAPWKKLVAMLHNFLCAAQRDGLQLSLARLE